jgi:Molybdopterin oxidoreductase
VPAACVRPCAGMRIWTKYVEATWEHGFDEIGRELRALEPDAAVFYTSGRASLETAYMYQIFARMYGTNNLPDSSNMCHESTSVGLTKSIGVGVGTITLDDFKHTDLMFFFGQNVGTNSPRMLHGLQEARERGVPIITFNPIREPGLVSFVNPQSPTQMLKPGATQISKQYHQLKTGGDSAAIIGICKAVLEADEHCVCMYYLACSDVGKGRRRTVSVGESTNGRCTSKAVLKIELAQWIAKARLLPDAGRSTTARSTRSRSGWVRPRCCRSVLGLSGRSGGGFVFNNGH